MGVYNYFMSQQCQSILFIITCYSIYSYIILCYRIYSFNTYNAAGVSRRQDQYVTNFEKNVNILEFGYCIWNPFEKCIRKSPNMPGIGSLICKIDVNVFRNLRNKHAFFCSEKPMPAC